MPPKPRFTDGEKVLCFHGPLLYEAKCLDSQIKDKHMKYFIHYSGWNKNWDEWVSESRVLKYNSVNLQKQKELEEIHVKSKKSKSSKTTVKKEPEKEKESTPVPPPPVATKQQKSVERKVAVSSPAVQSPSQPIEPKKVTIKTEPIFEVNQSYGVTIKTEPIFEEEPKNPIEIKFTIPQSLQAWLTDDVDLIKTQKKILHLPARITVDHIIANYVKEKVSVKGLSSSMETTIVQVANRIRDCFNVLLGKNLLYKFERPQYCEMLMEHKDLQMCEIYGAIHLLRMFTTLGEMLSSVASECGMMTVLVNHIEDFIRYMAANPSFFSLNDYVVASPEYTRRALT